MLKPHYRVNLLTCNINVAAFAAVMFVLVYMFMMNSVYSLNRHSGIGVDIPITSRPVSMSHADREDALVVAVMRDGSMFFGSGRVSGSDLPGKIQERVSRGAERKIYIKADARAKYRAVKEVLDGVHASGIEQIGILVEQRKPAPAP